MPLGLCVGQLFKTCMLTGLLIGDTATDQLFNEIIRCSQPADSDGGTVTGQPVA